MSEYRRLRVLATGNFVLRIELGAKNYLDLAQELIAKIKMQKQ